MRRGVWALVVAAAWTWLALLAWAPGARAQQPGGARLLAGGVYLLGAGVCHQQPDRSFAIAGQPLPVCARCTGLYAGGAIGALLWGLRRASAAPARTRRRLVLALGAAAMPTAVSVGAAWIADTDVANLPRALLALPLGGALGAAVAAAARGEVDG